MNLRLITGFIAVLLFSVNSAQAAIYTSGHADIAAGFRNNDLYMHINADTVNLFGGGSLPAGQYDPNAMMIGVPGPSVPRPAGSQWDFLASSAGAPIWFIPQGSVPNKPFLGLAADDLLASDGWSTLNWSFDSITTVSGQSSEFSLWQDQLGVSVVVASSLTPTPGGNKWDKPAAGHDHFNIGFTGEGIYDVVLTVSASNSGVGTIAAGNYTDTGTYRFVTGTAIPEPSSLLVLGAATIIGAGLRRRRT